MCPPIEINVTILKNRRNVIFMWIHLRYGHSEKLLSDVLHISYKFADRTIEFLQNIRHPYGFIDEDNVGRPHDVMLKGMLYHEDSILFNEDVVRNLPANKMTWKGSK